MVHCVDRRPGTTFRLFFADATFAVALFDVVGLALLLVRVLRFVTARHGTLPVSFIVHEFCVEKHSTTVLTHDWQHRFAIPMPAR